VLATDQRLILVDHRFSFIQPTTQRLHAIDSIAWSNVQEAKVTGLFLKKSLKVRGNGERGPVALKMVISNTLFGLLAPMRNNMLGARSVAAAATQAMQGGGAPALGPAPQQYGAPPMSYQPPPAQLQQPSFAPPQPSFAPPMPQINAPGYNSVPPPAPQYGAPQQPYGASPYGAVPAPVPSPFDPSRQY
jgi:hypothetical protein